MNTIKYSATPAYRKFEFEDTIDGTEASLAQYRSGYPTIGTVSTFVGLGMLTGLGTELNLTSQRSARYDFQDSKPLHASYDSKASVTSGMNSSTDSNKTQNSLSKRKQKEHKKPSESLVSLDNLPGTPTDDFH